MKTVTLKIQGMHCASCPIMIDGRLEDDVAGVKSAQTSYAKQECVVEYDEAVVQPEKILNALDEIGYPSQLFESP